MFRTLLLDIITHTDTNPYLQKHVKSLPFECFKTNLMTNDAPVRAAKTVKASEDYKCGDSLYCRVFIKW